MSQRSTSVVAIAVLTAALALGACDPEPRDTGGESQTRAAGGGGGTVVAPGKPGEPARTLSPEEARAAVPPDTPNSADFAYVEMMIVHHGQALEMTALVPQRAASTQVKQVAARIAAAQRPEVGAMRGWLEKHRGSRPSGTPGEGHGHGTGHGHGSGQGSGGGSGQGSGGGSGQGPGGGSGHGSMPGMATAGQLERLRAARGPAFDELFLTLMITHHQGAVTMATEALSQGNNVLVEEMANDVIAQQTAEIVRMRGM
ncbi:DUF305 domain-containing protein [Streptomyces sp. NPDC015131]|uniref:DUF305 domain-containing protein n=1 Tax=Streptomyces sp. NPDC015131 TaxID=3364941 RepID=UPI0036F8F2E0